MTCIDGDDNGYFTYNGIEMPGIKSRIRTEYFHINNEQRTKESDEVKQNE
jgi:hypothetical protein